MLTKDQFSNNLKLAMKKKNISQAKLAEKINTSAANITNYTNGKAFPYPDMLAEISVALSVSIDELCGVDVIASKKEHSFENMADQARALIALIESGCVRCHEKVRSEEGYSYYATVFVQPNSTLAEFLSERIKVRQICSKIEMGDELYSTWLDSRLKSLSEIPCESAELPF